MLLRYLALIDLRIVLTALFADNFIIRRDVACILKIQEPVKKWRPCLYIRGNEGYTNINTNSLN